MIYQPRAAVGAIFIELIGVYCTGRNWIFNIIEGLATTEQKKTRKRAIFGNVVGICCFSQLLERALSRRSRATSRKTLLELC